MNIQTALVFMTLLPVCLSFNSSINDLNVTKLRNDFLKFLDLPESYQQTLKQKRSSVPSYVKSLYHTRISQQDVIRVFFPKVRTQKTNTILYEFKFNLSSIRSEDEAIINAELKLQRRRTRTKGFVRFCSLALFGQESPRKRGKNKHRSKAPKFIKIEVLPLSGKSLWIGFNVSSVLTEHLKQQKEKTIQFKLYLQAYGTSLPPKSWINRHGKNKPFLVVFSRLLKVKKKTSLEPKSVVNLSKKVQSRSKRANRNSLCRRRRMFVKFSSINLNWMIAPTGFSAYKCEGVCPEVLTSYYNPTNHAILQNFVHYRLNKHIPRATCVPTKLESLTILYEDIGDSVTLREFPDMVVEKCGCR